MQYHVAASPQEAEAVLRILLENIGDVLYTICMRVYLADGTWQDVAIGGSVQQRAEALAQLRTLRDKAN